jgi:lysozyme
MKSAVFALITALLVAGLVLTPANAAVTAAPLAGACGDTYVVQRGDYLNLIARTCGVTLTDLLNANPQITNMNRIYPGQVIRIVPGSTIPLPPAPPPPSNTTYTVRWGDTLAVIAWRFGTSISTLLSLNPNIVNPSLIYAGQVLRLPGSTTTPTQPGTVPVTGSRVSISNSSVKAGGTVTVSVWSFPASAEIDFRLGKQGEAATVFVDAVTDAYGRATTTLTIPTTAVSGEKWVVLVLTTSQPAGKNIETLSPAITIVP